MTSSYARKMRSLAIAAAALTCFAASNKLFAAGTCTTPPCVTYTAAGTFSGTVVKGTDTFKLAGQKFSISVNLVPESAIPFKKGTGFDEYNKLNMTGTVNSGLDPTPITLTSNAAQIELAIEQTKNVDVFSLFTPVKVLGLTFNIIAQIKAPYGTITKLTVYPFSAPVTLSSTNNQVVYSYTPSGGTPQSTTLTIATGTLSTTVTTTAPPTGGRIVMLHAAHPEGTPDTTVLAAASAVHVRQNRLEYSC
jgi:hypothetical protein